MFTNPIGLALVFAVPLLVLAYRKRKSAKTQIVSSLLILKTLTTRPVPKKRIKLPLRFYIEALALLALAIASALPVIKPAGKKIAVIIDNSLSMSAINANKLSRLGLALEKFKKEKNSIDSYSLFESSPKLTLRPGQITTSATPDNLFNTSSELATETNYDKIWIFSDKKIEAEDPLITSYQVGSTEVNAYIQSATLNKANAGEEINIKVALSGTKSEKIEVSLSAVNFSGKTTRKIGLESVNVSPQKISSINFSSQENELAYKIEIKPSGFDAIEIDNTAWIVGNPEPSSQLLLVSEKANGLEKIPGFKVNRVSSEQFAKNDSLEKYSLVIFHRSAPSSPPNKPSLLILPPSDNAFFPASAEQTLKISSWDETHPINSYLRVNLIKPNKGIEFKTPNWAQAVISGEKGSIIAAGQYSGSLMAASGIELLPYEGKKTPSLSILTVNLIKWLTNQEHISAEKTTGDKFTIPPETSWVVIRPDQEVIELKSSNQERAIDLNLPGIYLLSRKDLSASAIGVNCFHSNESDTNSIQELTLSSTQIKKAKEESNWWKYLTITAIIFLMLEMLMRRFEEKRVA